MKRCGVLVHNALRAVPGVACAQIDVGKGMASVRGSANFEDLAKAVEGAGFRATHVCELDRCCAVPTKPENDDTDEDANARTPIRDNFGPTPLTWNETVGQKDSPGVCMMSNQTPPRKDKKVHRERADTKESEDIKEIELGHLADTRFVSIALCMFLKSWQINI